MLETLVDVLFAVLLYVGFPALFAVFVLKGAFVGKPLPTSVILPGYVLAISANRIETAGIVLVSSAGYVIGQLLIYYLARREDCRRSSRHRGYTSRPTGSTRRNGGSSSTAASVCSSRTSFRISVG